MIIDDEEQTAMGQKQSNQPRRGDRPTEAAPALDAEPSAPVPRRERPTDILKRHMEGRRRREAEKRAKP